MLTRKHHKAIAKIINRQANCHSESDLILITATKEIAKVYASDLADYFVTDNPCFNREKFLKACLED